MTERLLPVPEGLAGERLDIALTRLIGLSRTRAAELVAEGAVLVDGRPGVKSDRLLAGSVLTVDLREPERAPIRPPEPVPGMRVLFDDDDVVVVDKPVGVAAHPSPGWGGPAVV
ncbi:MAG: S4 domain-containing protein, partial [Actinobacteria bacterium]|nr:S4 domain-containing protein [Actinomycetota bacterium]